MSSTWYCYVVVMLAMTRSDCKNVIIMQMFLFNNASTDNVSTVHFEISGSTYAPVGEV